MAPPHLMTLADLSVNQLTKVLAHSARLKSLSKPLLQPHPLRTTLQPQYPPQSLAFKTIALLFSKRSTRTRVAAETGAALLGGKAMFLGKEDIQLGVNESAEDTAKVLGTMVQGIFARVGGHEEIEVAILCSYYLFGHYLRHHYIRNLPAIHLCLLSTPFHLCGIPLKFWQISSLYTNTPTSSLQLPKFLIPTYPPFVP